MLTIKPVIMMTLGQTWHKVEDEKGCGLGAFPTEAAAARYKHRLEERGINCAEDMISRGSTPWHREAMRFLMAPEAYA